MQKCQKEIKCKKVKENKRKGQPKGQKELQEKKNSSLTQAIGGRREKSFLTTQENFWCVKL